MKWSYSAHRAMRRCQRQFAFEHLVASHNSTDPLRREAFLLKQLQTLSLWQGDIVHHVLAQELPHVVQSKEAIAPHHLTEVAFALMERQLRFSEAQRYLIAGQTKTSAGDEYCALVEHKDGQAIAPTSLAAVQHAIATCFDNLAAAGDFIQSLQAGSGHQFEQWASFALDDIAITARLDLVFRTRTGRTAVVDWKVATSETSDYSSQLLTYALALVRNHVSVSADRIDLYEFNLLKGELRRHPVDLDKLNEIEDLIFRSIIDMKALCGSGKYDDLDLDDFDVARQPGTCALCKYSTLCIENLVASAQTEKALLVQGRLL